MVFMNKCSLCKKALEIKSQRLKNSKSGKYFCCQKHFGIYYHLNTRKKVRCEFCHKEFFRQPNHAHKYNFCNRSHYFKWVKSKRRERFWNRVVKNNSGCWKWIGKKSKFGYGLFINGFMAHRYSYLIHYGKVPHNKCVLHNCDNPECTNPEHLKIGTHSDNSKDKFLRGRVLIGEKHHRAKLKNSDILKIRNLLAIGRSRRVIANIFSISISNVSAISTRRSWKHI